MPTNYRTEYDPGGGIRIRRFTPDDLRTVYQNLVNSTVPVDTIAAATDTIMDELDRLAIDLRLEIFENDEDGMEQDGSSEELDSFLNSFKIIERG